MIVRRGRGEERSGEALFGKVIVSGVITTRSELHSFSAEGEGMRDEALSDSTIQLLSSPVLSLSLSLALSLSLFLSRSLSFTLTHTHIYAHLYVFALISHFTWLCEKSSGA